MKLSTSIKSHLIFLFTLFFSNIYISAQTDSLRAQIEQITSASQGTVGVAIIGPGKDDTLTFNGNSKLPMQSVYKFPLALAVLNEVNKGIFTLDQKIHISKEDLHPDTWSPLRDKYPAGNVDIALSEIINYTVSQSDNNACDILFRLIGGTQVVNEYIHNLGVKDISIAATEEEMHKDWSVQYTNWCTPLTMAQLLEIFYSGNVLSKGNKDFLWKCMVETFSGRNMIKGLLPEGTIVAHKTGSSGTNEAGITAALNDAGIVMLPDGKHFTIVIFVSDSPDNKQTNETLIAKISKAVWEYMVTGH